MDDSCLVIILTTGSCVEDLGDINVCVEHSFPVSAESIQENDGPSEVPIEETNGSASETTNDGEKNLGDFRGSCCDYMRSLLRGYAAKQSKERRCT